MQYKCSTCKSIKDETEFYNFKKEARCKPCSKAKALKWGRDNPEHKWGLGLKRAGYWPGLSAKECCKRYQEMFEVQGGCCAVCGTHQSEEERRLAVDHNHSTGKVRELLCMSCNRGIGLITDNPDILQKAVDYIRKHL